MIICPNCQFENREGFLFCENCGNPLGTEDIKAAKGTIILGRTSTNLSAKATWGTARLNRDSLVVLHVRDARESVEVEAAQRTVLGRSDSTSATKPDLDLTPYGALEKGVSRLHAAIDRSDDTLTIVDMGSSNGTHLNGQRLVANQPRVLRDGDEIRLGKLIAHIYFR